MPKEQDSGEVKATVGIAAARFSVVRYDDLGWMALSRPFNHLMTKSPRVSVVIPVLNDEDHPSFYIESILAQNYGDYELIIADNACSDMTGEIIASYSHHTRI
jgi:cellulose synthase/poly-beta-1,6-N-acetylglucosamine synthase-like glycosyltransferase